jgi:hypothetical protein
MIGILLVIPVGVRSLSQYLTAKSGSDPSNHFLHGCPKTNQASLKFIHESNLRPLMNHLILRVIFVSFAFLPHMAYATERTLTLYSLIMESASMNMADAPSRSMGDGLVSHNNLYLAPNQAGEPAAFAETSLLITIPASSQNGNMETRIFHMIIHYPNGVDSLAIDGLSIAMVPDNWMQMTTPSWRAITGGTGRYNGAKGQAKFTRITQDFVKIELSYSINK